MPTASYPVCLTLKSQVIRSLEGQDVTNLRQGRYLCRVHVLIYGCPHRVGNLRWILFMICDYRVLTRLGQHEKIPHLLTHVMVSMAKHGASDTPVPVPLDLLNLLKYVCVIVYS